MNKSYTYDSRGNILEKKTYAFTLGTLGTAQKTDSYGYATDSWKDRLTSYNGSTITYDAIGNPLTYNNGSAYTFTWEGRQMQTATKGNTTWTYTYNADGLRIGKTNGTTTYTYTWNENRQLSSMTWNTGYALFYYDADGIPYAVQNYDAILDVERTYLYVTNLQGDVLSIIDASSGATAVTYTYDAWGRLISKSGTSSDYASIYEYNPLTYRGYIYDSETGFYYLQSRYYDPTVGRFLNADDTQYLGASGTLLSLNLFVYCENDPVNLVDSTGTSSYSPKEEIQRYIGEAWMARLMNKYISKLIRDKVELIHFSCLGFEISLFLTVTANNPKDNRNVKLSKSGFEASFKNVSFSLGWGGKLESSFNISSGRYGVGIMKGRDWRKSYLALMATYTTKDSRMVFTMGVYVSMSHLLKLAVAVTVAGACVLVPVITPAVGGVVAAISSSGSIAAIGLKLFNGFSCVAA